MRGDGGLDQCSGSDGSGAGGERLDSRFDGKETLRRYTSRLDVGQDNTILLIAKTYFSDASTFSPTGCAHPAQMTRYTRVTRLVLPPVRPLATPDPDSDLVTFKPSNETPSRLLLVLSSLTPNKGACCWVLPLSWLPTCLGESVPWTLLLHGSLHWGIGPLSLGPMSIINPFISYASGNSQCNFHCCVGMILKDPTRATYSSIHNTNTKVFGLRNWERGVIIFWAGKGNQKCRFSRWFYSSDDSEALLLIFRSWTRETCLEKKWKLLWVR